MTRLAAVVLGTMGTESILTLLIAAANVGVSAAAVWLKVKRGNDDHGDADDV